jgi:hypothetical protein
MVGDDAHAGLGDGMETPQASASLGSATREHTTAAA